MATNRSVLAILALLGCFALPEPAAPPEGLGFAYAAPSCAPWDGYAVSLVLRRSPLVPGDSAIEAGDFPQLRLALYPRQTGSAGLSGLRPGTYRWPAAPEVAIGAWCDATQCTPSPTGRITVREAARDGRLTGAIELLLQDGRTLRGSFDAEWRPRRMFCF